MSNCPQEKVIKRNFTLILKNHWKIKGASSRLSTETIYAVQKPLSRPRLELTNIRNEIRYEKVTLFWKEMGCIIFHIYCVLVCLFDDLIFIHKLKYTSGVCLLCIKFQYTENPGWKLTQGCQCTFTAVREDFSVGVTQIPDPHCFQRFIHCHPVPRPWGCEEDLLAFVSPPQSLRCVHYDVGIFESKLFLSEMPEGI